MNPFNYTGPDFLVFYAILGAVVIAAVWLWRHGNPLSSATADGLTDPYLIACLRGGPNEAVRVAVCALVERGLLVADENLIRTARPGTEYLATRPLERAILKELVKPRHSESVFVAPQVAAAAAELENRLVEKGLLADRSKGVSVGAGMALLGGVAATKLYVALSRGRTNVVFLIMLAVFFLVVLARMAQTRRTIPGFRVLGDLRRLFRRSRALGYTGSAHSPDLAVLAGVFGLAAVWNHTRSGEFRKLYPKSANERGAVTYGGSSCGSGSSFGSTSSCGGSSCSSGGGCGGGGGGCGGCGSS